MKRLLSLLLALLMIGTAGVCAAEDAEATEIPPEETGRAAARNPRQTVRLFSGAGRISRDRHDGGSES